ncbi:unnamed protein product [Ectocarpus fasciculatus]
MTINIYMLANLFPYSGTMVKQLLSLDTNEVGFYAGYVASAFTFGRFLSGYFWGFVTDRLGRKPVIIIGLLSMTTFSVLFGTSRTYTMAIASRFILGLTNGIMPALRTTLSEVCGKEHVVQGMTYTNAATSISLIFGTGIGGLLAQPALHYPGVFSATGLFGRFPFLLPNLVGAAMSVLTLILVIFFLPETKDYAEQQSGVAIADEVSVSKKGDESGLRAPSGVLATPHVKTVLFLICVTSAVDIGFDEVYPLFALSTPDVGGLGWSTLEIGKVLVMTGVLMAFCELFLFPPLIKLVGITTWQRLGCRTGIAAFLAIPAVKVFSWDFNSLVGFSVAVNTLANCSCAAVCLALYIGSTTLVPSNMRGKLSGLFSTAESLGRFIGPAGYAIVYAWCVSPSTLAAFGGWVDYRFVFYASAAALASVSVLAWRTLTTENLMKPDSCSGENVDADVVANNV